MVWDDEIIQWRTVDLCLRSILDAKPDESAVRGFSTLAQEKGRPTAHRWSLVQIPSALCSMPIVASWLALRPMAI